MNCRCGHPYDEHDVSPAPDREVLSVCKHCTCTALLPIKPTYRPQPQQPTWIVRVPCSVRAGADNDADQGIGEVRGDAIVLRVRAANAPDAVTKIINAIVWAYSMTEPRGSISHAERPRDEAIAEHARTLGLENIDPASVPPLGTSEALTVKQTIERPRDELAHRAHGLRFRVGDRIAIRVDRPTNRELVIEEATELTAGLAEQIGAAFLLAAADARTIERAEVSIPVKMIGAQLLNTTAPCATNGCALHAVERVPLCAGHAAEARASKVPA